MSLAGYAAAGLGMDEVGVYCSWDMPVPGRSTLHHPLHDVPGERSFSATRVLVVCSACQVQRGWVFVNRRLSAGLPAGVPSFGAVGTLGHSWFDPSCTVVPSHSSALLGILSSPSFPRVVPHLVCVLFPHPIHLPPSCSPLSPVSFFVPHTSDSSFPFFVPSPLF